VNATVAGLFSLQFRYANGSTTPSFSTVNGITVAGSLALHPRAAGQIWSFSSATVHLVAAPTKSA